MKLSTKVLLVLVLALLVLELSADRKRKRCKGPWCRGRKKSSRSSECKRKIEELSNSLAATNREIDRLKTKDMTLMDFDQKLVENDTKLAEKDMALMEFDGNVTQNLTKVNDHINVFKQNISDLHDKIKAVNSSVETLQNKTSMKAAFQAQGMLAAMPPGMVVNLNEETDDGDNFDPATNAFEAPCTGSYQFTVCATAPMQAPTMTSQVSVNLNKVPAIPPLPPVQAEAVDGATVDATTCMTFILRCTMGSLVNVMTADPFTFTAGMATIKFNGHLIHCDH